MTRAAKSKAARVSKMTRAAKSKAMEEEGDVDRISNLPEFIVHQILSCLDTKDAARTGVLSKTWFQFYSTIPILIFKEYDFEMKPDYSKGFVSIKKYKNMSKKSFINFVNSTLSRYKSLNLSIHKIHIISSLLDAPSTASLVENWIKLAIDCGLQHLIISHTGNPNISWLSPTPLPSIIFESPNRSLTYLTVFNCTFPQNVVTTSVSKCNAIIFPFLKKLKLHWCFIDDQMLQKLLSASPSLENILFYQPSGFKKFRVCNLPQLKTIEMLQINCEIEVDIENAPELLFVKYVGYFSYDRLKVPFSLKVASAPNLKCLKLKEVSICDNQLCELVAKLPSLEDLKLSWCRDLERINIANDSLKQFRFSHCKNIVEVIIDAPSLLELKYNGGNLLSLSLNNTSQELMAHLHIVPYYDQDYDALNHQLKELLRSLNRARVTLIISELDIGFDTTLDFVANPLPPEHQTGNFMQEMDLSSSLFVGILNTLFSSSRPTTIATLESFSFHDFSKFLSSELMTTTRNLKCCGSDKIKCWRHFLKNIEVEVYDDSLKVWQSIHPEALQSESTFPDKMIRFSLQWYDNLNDQA